MDPTFADWLLSRTRRTRVRPLSVHTLRHKVSSINTVRRVAVELLGITNQALGDAELATWLAHRENVEELWDVLSIRTEAGTQRNTFYALRDFEAFAKAMRWVPSLALSSNDLVPAESKPVEVFSAAEMTAIEIGARMKGKRWHLFVVTLLETGMRIGNALSLTYDQVVLDHEVPHFRLPTSKTGRPLVVPLSSKLQILWDANTMHELQHEHVPGNRKPARDLAVHPFPWSYSNALARWKDMLTALEIEYRSPHKARATLATDLLVKGAPLLGVATLLGHTSLNTTQRYYAAVSALTYADLLEQR